MPAARCSCPVIESYQLDYDLDYQKSELRCSCELIIRNNTARSIKNIPLLLYHRLKVHSITTSRDREVQFRQRVIPFKDMRRYRANCIEVALPRPLPAKRSIKLSMAFAGKLSGYTETGMRYIRDSIRKEFTVLRPDCRAYPEIGYPSWKRTVKLGQQWFDYTLNVTVPEQLVVANGGKLVSRVTVRGKTTYQYRNTKPAWRIDATIARYTVARYQSERLKVFAFKKDVMRTKQIASSFVSAKHAFSKMMGPLKGFHGFSIIEVPDGYGSQADVTCILQERNAFNDRKAIENLYHETAHLWDVPSLDEFPARFESEGKATFFQYWMKAHADKKEKALEFGFNHCLEKAQKYLVKNAAARLIPMTRYGETMLTDLSYTKGMIFFYLLYRIMGEPSFGKTLGSFYQHYFLRGARTTDFIAHLHGLKNAHVNRLLEEWVTGTKSNERIAAYAGVDDFVRTYVV